MRERSAIEALRAGVPNRAAIRLLGTDESELQDRFLDRLRACRAELRGDRQAGGIILAGGFGAGKSHLLGYMRELALQDNFIVSLVPVSKETPLFDPAKLYAAAIRNAVVPQRIDDAMTAAMARLEPGSERYEELERWASGAHSGMSALFAALLYLIPKRQLAVDDLAAVTRFFGGASLSIATVRRWLRAAGAAKLFDLKPVKASELAVQRRRFAPRLFAAAGYAGWCVLLDEVELVGRYGPLQRGKSYAELARWLGLDRTRQLPGIVSVCAVTDDFADVVVGERRDDEIVPAKLEAKGLAEQADLARLGIEALAKRPVRLRQPDEPTLRRSLEKVRGLYRDAYGWSAPEIGIGERLTGSTMRQYIKSWITAWDIERLYGERPEIAADDLRRSYAEAAGMEGTPGDDGERDGEG